MPSEKSARVQEKKRIRNRLVRNATRTQIRKAQETITDGDSDSSVEEVKKALSALDKAAHKGVIHKNNAARRKSRLMARVNSTSS